MPLEHQVLCMKTQFKFFKKLYSNILRSIVVYHVLIGLGFLFAARFFIATEKWPFIKTFKEELPDGKITLIHMSITAKELMRIVVQPIRSYSRHDSAVMHRLTGALKLIIDRPQISEEIRAIISEELEAIREGISNGIDNQTDKKGLLQLLN